MHLNKYIVPVLTLLALAGFCYFFSSVVVYIIIALVLTLIGRPVKQFITQFKIGKFSVHDGLASLLTLVLFMGIIFLLGFIFLPPLVKEVDFLSKLNLYDVIHNIFAQYPELNKAMSSFGTQEDVKLAITEQMNAFINFNNVSYILNHTLSYASTILGGAFSVLFMTFFFLKDEKMVVKLLLLVTPTNYEGAMFDIIRTSRSMLGKYFTGLFIDMLLVSFLVTLCMWLFGVKNALMIGCMAGVMNVIPYVGPIITMLFSIFLGVSGCIEYGQYELISSTITKIVLILISITLTDAILIQPFIFSNTVKAHPLELFVVVLMSGIIGGITGMIVAIPAYTLIRIIAKEFLIRFKFFKKLTENIPE
ncbi:MAG: AI-2E family transporter [Bacteroidetes bacterium]|nr:AI-2E family transporter [Bacteroidota bacterium]